MNTPREEAIEEAEQALRMSDYGATWPITLGELYDRAASGNQRLETAAERIATALEGIAGSLKTEGRHGEDVGLATLIARINL